MCIKLNIGRQVQVGITRAQSAAGTHIVVSIVFVTLFGFMVLNKAVKIFTEQR